MKNITGFLMDQNRQFDDAIRGLTYARDSLDGARYNPHRFHLNKLIYAFSGYETMTFSLLWMFLPPVPTGVSPSLSKYGEVHG
jgi:mediator of RNA polymerase II transcription subunit 14